MDPVLKMSDTASGLEVPVIDLQGSSHGERHGVVVQKIRKACMEWGGFQIINHGVSAALMERMRRVAGGFFALPVADKWKFSASTSTTTHGLFQGYGTKERGSKGALDQGDQLRHKTWPLSRRAYELWPTNPTSFRETEEEYVAEQAKLCRHLLELISESLGLSASYLNNFFGEYQQTFLVNHFPPSPEPTTPTVGFQSHSDFGTLTILMQDVAGLQLKRNGEWISVEPIPGAFAINLGDQTEILTNGLYKSPEHGALLNSNERFSIAVFSNPLEDKLIAPIAELVPDSQPIRYKARTFAAYKTQVLTIPDMAKGLAPDT